MRVTSYCSKVAIFVQHSIHFTPFDVIDKINLPSLLPFSSSFKHKFNVFHEMICSSAMKMDRVLRLALPSNPFAIQYFHAVIKPLALYCYYYPYT